MWLSMEGGGRRCVEQWRKVIMERGEEVCRTVEEGEYGKGGGGGM